ncbi:MAG: ATP-dependent DNA helicase RecG [Clostridia bacterium]|nr:ATP-dependent DNA helicase RecG [Clostridia bacterium]
MRLEEIKGVGKSRLETLERAGIHEIGDLILTLPSSYMDTTRTARMADAPEGECICVEGEVVRVGRPARFNGRSTVRMTVRDATGSLEIVFINQPWASEQYAAGNHAALYGRVSLMKNGARGMYCPRKVTERGILPEYRTLKEIPSKTLRNIMREALGHVDECCPETLPERIRRQWDLPDRGKALRDIHFPPDRESLDAALRRMAFEEVLYFEAGAALLRGSRREGRAFSLKAGDDDAFWGACDFPPTSAQRRVLGEIRDDMASGRAMGRLVQGDVGSGKTAVAFGAMYLAFVSGYQSAMMAPTEILARQHGESAQRILAKLGMRCEVVTGSMKASERKRVAAMAAAGEVDAVIGTHALLSGDIAFSRLGLVVCDEQHRFGVRQRGLLSSKGEGEGAQVHTLVMSATPIPRTLALILYGDLDVSVIDEMPPGRTPVRTRIVPEEKREGMLRFIRQETERGKQAYIVCPLVEENENPELRSAREEYRCLKNNGPLKDVSLGVTWGGQKEEEKQRTLSDFASGRISVLVATTVIEVGVNVPRATVMVIENAERFGLSQLHQLRGRVGRGQDESWCFLMSSPNGRLSALCRTSDGFKIAEEDLRQRGPGDFLGTRQHGQPLLPAAALGGDGRILEEAARCMEELKKEEYAPEREQILRKAEMIWAGRLDAGVLN